MEVKGTAVKSIPEYVKSNFDSKYSEWFNSLDEKSQSIIRGPVYATNWYPVEDATVKPTESISKLFFNGDIEKAAWESGRYSAEMALKGVYRFFVKASTPSFIIARASSIFSGYYRPCELKLVDKSNNAVLLHLSGDENDKACIVTQSRIGGWIQKALEISGCKEVRIDFPKTMVKGDDITVFDIKW